MYKRDIVVIGASAGGIAPIIEIVKALPKDFKASVFIVVHVSPASPSSLPAILTRSGPLKAIHPMDREKIEPGKIYVAPPDHHLLIEDGHTVVKKGPKENRFRPSVDALFRSAAYEYGSRVIGVVLSGFLDDGTSGLWSVKRLGGISIIQQPEESEFPDMPLNVLEYVDVDYKLKASEIAPMLVKLTEEKAPKTPKLSAEELKRMKLEIVIAYTGNAFELGILSMGKLTSFTCPECHGALVSLDEGNLTRFRCHTGHGYTTSTLLAGVTKVIDENLWEAMRGIEEATLILEELGAKFNAKGKTDDAKLFLKKADEARKRSKVIHGLTFEQEIMSADIRHKK